MPSYKGALFLCELSELDIFVLDTFWAGAYGLALRPTAPHAEPPMRQERLKPPSFHILPALAERDLHGLGIADWVEQMTAGRAEIVRRSARS